MIDLAFNYPLPGPRADELMADLAARITADPAGVTRYLPVEGLPEHLEAAARWLSLPGDEIAPDRVGFGVGGHQLLVAIVLGLTRAGEAVACDPVTYNGWLNVLRHTERRPVAVAGDAEGMLPEALDEAAARGGLWGVFLMPSLHNPCATSLSLARRRQLVEVCRRRNLWIVDDDAYRFLCAEAPPSFAHLAPERAIWIQSLTKPLFPGVKTALFAAPAEAMPRLREAVRISGNQPSALTLPWVLELLSSGSLERLVAEKRAEARRRRGLCTETLAGLRVNGPASSFHVWVELPAGWDSASAHAALRAAGVAVVPGASYAVDGTAPPAAIRVALAGEADPERVAEGLRLVGQVLRRER